MKYTENHPVYDCLSIQRKDIHDNIVNTQPALFVAQFQIKPTRILWNSKPKQLAEFKWKIFIGRYSLFLGQIVLILLQIPFIAKWIYPCFTVKNANKTQNKIETRTHSVGLSLFSFSTFVRFMCNRSITQNEMAQKQIFGIFIEPPCKRTRSSCVKIRIKSSI